MSNPIVPQSSTNVLVLLPAKVRQATYVAFGILSLVNSSALVGYAAGAFALPEWLIVSTAVLQFLGTSVATVAATNVSKGKAEADSTGR